MKTEEIIELLNPWWKEGAISSDLNKSFRRDKFKEIEKIFSKRQISIITGLRRVGKTTSMYQLIGDLVEKNDPKNIFYFNFDNEVEDISDLLEKYSVVSGVNWKKEKIYVFFDEVSKLDNWSSKLKLIYDSFPNIKFVVSSSSSSNLEKDAVKNLAGRYFLVTLCPLNFKEYLFLRKKGKFIENINLYEKEIRQEFNRYLIRSFPEIIDYDDELLIKDYFRSTLIDKIIRDDLRDKFENVNSSLLFRLVELIYLEPGIYLDHENLSKNLRVSKKTLMVHMQYLEFSYLVRIVKNYRPSSMSSSRKMQRAYPYWFSLGFCYSENKDGILENMVGSLLDAEYYWREKEKEVDFLVVNNKKIIPFEVKNKEKLTKRDFRPMEFFMSKFNINEGNIIYSGDKDFFKQDNGINIIPAWKWILS